VVAADSELIAAGLSAYRAQYCGICHLLDAAETRGTFGPTHNLLGATAAAYLADGTYVGGATTPAEYIRESIVDPQAFIVPGYATTSHRMPSYAHLDATTLDALVAFLLAQ
jgi:mono/diheme cytochrome c family protein